MYGNKTAEAGSIYILLQNINSYYALILVCLGFLGNCLSICVFLGTKLRHSSCNIYLAALAISDTGVLMVLFVHWLQTVHIDLLRHTCFCKFFLYLGYVCGFLSVWFIVAFTTERFMAIRYPLRCHSICTVAKAKMVVIGLLGLGILVAGPILLFVTPRVLANATGNEIECDMDEDWRFWANIYNTIDTVILTFLTPSIIIIILNALIVRNIYKLGRIRKTLTIESDVSNGKNIYAPNQSILSQTKITKMLLIVSSVFLCLNLPSYVMRMFAFKMQDKSQTFDLAEKVCYLLYYTNFGINFVLYYVSGQNFRRTMVHMFTCRSRQRNKIFTPMTTSGKKYTGSGPTFPKNRVSNNCRS